MAWMTAASVSPVNGACPASISNVIAPNANTSVRASISSLRPVACSGAMYCGVPSSAASCVSTVFDPRIFEMPKSSTLTTSRTSPPRSVGQRKTLSGFRSRWTIALAVRRGQRRADLA